MSAQHTPGPWTARPDGWVSARPTEPGYTIYVARTHNVCAVHEPDAAAENKANANLIAAAPDLLAALEALMPTNVCLTNPNIRDRHQLPMDVEAGALRRAAAAIAKARGQ